MGASTEEATALRPNPLPLKHLIAESMYNNSNENLGTATRTHYPDIFPPGEEHPQNGNAHQHVHIRIRNENLEEIR